MSAFGWKADEVSQDKLPHLSSSSTVASPVVGHDGRAEMTLEQFYYIGELAGVVVVIVALLFVVKEIRQNTNQLRIGASNAWVELQMKLSTGIAENREVAELWVRGEDDAAYDALDRVDQTRLIMFEHRAIAAWSNLFQLRRQRLLPDAQWRELNGVMKVLGRRRAVRESWKKFKGGFEKSFQNFAGQYLD